MRSGCDATTPCAQLLQNATYHIAQTILTIGCFRRAAAPLRAWQLVLFFAPLRFGPSSAHAHLRIAGRERFRRVAQRRRPSLAAVEASPRAHAGALARHPRTPCAQHSPEACPACHSRARAPRHRSRTFNARRHLKTTILQKTISTASAHSTDFPPHLLSRQNYVYDAADSKCRFRAFQSSGQLAHLSSLSSRARLPRASARWSSALRVLA